MTNPSNKTSLIGVRFLPEEKEKLKQLALVQHQTLSEMLRSMILQQISRSSHRIIPEVNREVYFQLGKMAEYLETSEIDEATLNSFQELLKEIRRELLGLTT